MSYLSWLGYYRALLWRKHDQADYLVVHWRGGPKDGETLAIRRNMHHLVMMAPVTPAYARIEPDEVMATETLTTRQVVVPVEQWWTPLMTDEDSGWCVGVLEHVLPWPRGES